MNQLRHNHKMKMMPKQKSVNKKQQTPLEIDHSKNNLGKRQRRFLSLTGFTLLEIQIAAALIGLVVAAATAISLSSDTFFRSSTAQSKLQDDAAFLMEHMIMRLENGPTDGERIIGQGTGAYNVLVFPLLGNASYVAIQTTPSYNPPPHYFIRYLWATVFPQTVDQLIYYGESIEPVGGWNWVGGTVLSNTAPNRSRVEEVTWTALPSDNYPLRVQINITVSDPKASKNRITLRATAQLKQRPAQYPPPIDTP